MKVLHLFTNLLIFSIMYEFIIFLNNVNLPYIQTQNVLEIHKLS